MLDQVYKQRLAIFGTSGHAAVVADAAEKSGLFDVIGYVGEIGQGDEPIMGYPVLGTDSDVAQIKEVHRIDAVIVAVGDNAARRKIAETVRLSQPALSFATVLHPSVIVAKGVFIGCNTFVAAGAIVGPRTKIGSDCIINTGAKLDHDNTLEDFASVAPGVVSGGNCLIGQGSAIGIGAVIIHGIRIGSDTVIGGGAVVVDDLPDGVVAYGNPARVIRKRKRGERYL
ncbi:MAG: acetyltransferase [Xanthobacteraceae bacterium]|nr:acetyltransferase [Xanthobacteraceae bacterium]